MHVGTSNGYTFHFVLLVLLITGSISAHSQWSKLEAFPGSGRGWAAGFQIKNVVYTGSGFDSLSLTNDFYAFDARAQRWSEVSPLDGAERDDAVAFSVGGRGYIGLGICKDGDKSRMQKDVWQYDPKKNAWAKCADFPASGRLDPFVLKLGKKVIIGCGRDSIRTGKFLQDVWEYDPAKDSWKQLTDFPAAGRFRMIEGVVDGVGYTGLGQGAKGIYTDLWKFNPKDGSWKACASLPDSLKRLGAESFVWNDRIYVISGTNGRDWFNSTVAYDPKTDKWVPEKPFPGTSHAFGTAVSTKHGVLLTTGFTLKGYLRDSWFFKP